MWLNQIALGVSLEASYKRLSKGCIFPFKKLYRRWIEEEIFELAQFIFNFLETGFYL